MTQLRVVVATLGVICVLLLTETALALQSKVFRKSRFSYSLNAEMIPLDDMVIERELIPVANGLLIKVKEIPKQTAGGLFIPDEAKERPTEGASRSYSVFLQHLILPHSNPFPFDNRRSNGRWTWPTSSRDGKTD
jgi:hypothetical protein